MKSIKLASIFAAAAVLMSAATICAQAAKPAATAAKTTLSVKYAAGSAAGVYTVQKMPYGYNATAAKSIAVKGSSNQASSYTIAKGAKVCVIRVVRISNVLLYESVSKTGSSYIHGYVPTGTLNFRYQSRYTSINRQPVYSLDGKTRVGYLNKNQKATKLYMVGKKCAVLFDTKSGKNTGCGIVNYKGNRF